jgi:hypothetical protein
LNQNIFYEYRYKKDTKIATIDFLSKIDFFFILCLKIFSASTQVSTTMKEFQATVSAIIRGATTRYRGITEAIAFVRAVLESLEPERTKLIAEHCKLEASLDELAKRAQATQTDVDVLKLSEVQAQCDSLGKMLLDGTKKYSFVFEELKKLQQVETVRCAPIVFTVPNVETLRNKIAQLVVNMCQHWNAYDDKMERRVESVLRLQVSGRDMSLNIADVRGDGACGWRAFITGVIRIITGGQVRLSYDPAWMSEFVANAKVLVLELVQILALNPGNQEFIIALYNNPDNGARKTFDTYKTMVSQPSYHATNFEMRLLCVLFGMFDSRLSQVNVIRETPRFGEQYQSMSASGRIAPVSNEHINILHVPGHYKSVVHLTAGVLPHIYQVDAPLQF